MRRYKFDSDASPSVYATGKTISVLDNITPGQTVRVVYTTPPTALASASDVFSTVTGLPSSCVDMIVYGAIAKMLPGLEIARLQLGSIESVERAAQISPGSAIAASRYFYGMFEARLKEEKSRLQSLHPALIHYIS